MEKIISLEEKLLAKLPPAELAARLLTLPARRQAEILIEREDAEAVVAALPEPDFYFSVKELGEESAAPFLALARPEQINHLLDLDCWRRDEVLPGKALGWLEAIAAANGKKFLAWLYQADFELLVTLFKKWIEVKPLPEEMDHQEADDDLPPHTLDNQYFFAIRYPEYEELIKTILGYLFENHRGFYRELLHQVAASLETEYAELAYRFHRGRLADNAVPDHGKAAVIYRPLRPERLTRQKAVLSSHDEAGPPTFALALAPRRGLLAEALARVGEPAARETLQVELAALSNKVLVADDLDPGESENLRQAVNKAGAYLNLGLEEIAGGDPIQASTALTHIYLEELFRLGHSRIAAIRSRAAMLSRTGWVSRWPYGLNILDREWQEAVNLLISRTPMILRDPEQSGQSPTEDYIRTKADLRQAELLIAMLESVGTFFAAFEQEAGGAWERLSFRLWREGQLHSLHLVTLGNLLFTAAARQLATGTWEGAPLPVAAWPEIFSRLSPQRLEKILWNHFRQVLPGPTFTHAIRYLDPLLARYRTETGSFGPGQVPDARYVPFFMFTARQKRLA